MSLRECEGDRQFHPFHTQQFDECSCSLPRQWLCWSGKCDGACFTAGRTNKAAAGDVSGSDIQRAGVLTTVKGAGGTQLSSIFPFFRFKDHSFLLFSLLLHHSLISLSSCLLPSRYRHTVSLGSVAIMCGFCKPPQSLEATKGCADCKANFCNECFKLYHPWGTPRAQHEHILPTNNFRPKVWLVFCFCDIRSSFCSVAFVQYSFVP